MYNKIATHQAKTRTVKTREGRLKRITMKLNTAYKENDEIKHQIDDLRRDKIRRTKVVKRLEKKYRNKLNDNDVLQQQLDEANEATNQYIYTIIYIY